MARTRRAQILMEPEEYRRLEEIARSRKVSVGKLIRQAVQSAYPVAREDRRSIVEDICSMSVPLPDWETMEEEITEAHCDGVS